MEENNLLHFVKSIDQNMRDHRKESSVQHAALMTQLQMTKTKVDRQGGMLGVHKKALWVMGMTLLGVIVYLSSRDPQALAEIVKVAN